MTGQRQCEGYGLSVKGLTGVTFCRKDGARTVFELVHGLRTELIAVTKERDEHWLRIERLQAGPAQGWATPEEVAALKAELADWLKAHPPSLCSAHQVLDLSCRICNPALRDVEALKAELADQCRITTEKECERAEAQEREAALKAELARLRSDSAFADMVEAAERAQRLSDGLVTENATLKAQVERLKAWVIEVRDKLLMLLAIQSGAFGALAESFGQSTVALLTEAEPVCENCCKSPCAKYSECPPRKS